MPSILPLVTLLVAAPGVLPSSNPHYATPETRRVIEAMVAAHGGMEAWHQIAQVRYRFFTRNTGAPDPWLSWERVETRTGRSRIEWPVFGAVVAYDGDNVWHTGWPLPFSPGFFTHLTYGFITLPFQTQRTGVYLEAPEEGRVPGDSTRYITVRMTMDQPNGLLPGTYYRLFIHPETSILRALEFNISHPGLASNPTQPLGPNVHIFSDHRRVGGILLPVFYSTIGFNNRDQSTSQAVHYVFDLTVDQPFDNAVVQRPADAVTDTVTTRFWSRSR